MHATGVGVRVVPNGHHLGTIGYQWVPLSTSGYHSTCLGPEWVPFPSNFVVHEVHLLYKFEVHELHLLYKFLTFGYIYYINGYLWVPPGTFGYHWVPLPTTGYPVRPCPLPPSIHLVTTGFWAFFYIFFWARIFFWASLIFNMIFVPNPPCCTESIGCVMTLPCRPSIAAK